MTHRQPKWQRAIDVAQLLAVEPEGIDGDEMVERIAGAHGPVAELEWHERVAGAREATQALVRASFATCVDDRYRLTEQARTVDAAVRFLQHGEAGAPELVQRIVGTLETAMLDGDESWVADGDLAGRLELGPGEPGPLHEALAQLCQAWVVDRRDAGPDGAAEYRLRVTWLSPGRTFAEVEDSTRHTDGMI